MLEAIARIARIRGIATIAEFVVVTLMKLKDWECIILKAMVLFAPVSLNLIHISAIYSKIFLPNLVYFST